MFPSRRRSGVQSAVHAALRIENWRHIERAYGQDVAQSACESLCLQLTGLLRGDGEVAPGASGHIDLRIDSNVFGRDQAVKAIDAWLIDLCRTIPLLAIPTSIGPIHLWVSGCWSLPDSIMPLGRNTSIKSHRAGMNFHGQQPGDTDGWAMTYRADMALVARVISMMGSSTAAVDGAHANLFWQRISHGQNAETVLYHEALLRFVDRQGVARTPVEELEALERLGFVGLLDQHVASQVIDELEASQEAWLGVNVSALSLCSPGLWGEVMARLRGRPELAGRLFIEITETAAIPDMGEARRLIDELRGFGCQIVLDDFGMGHASLRQALALAPDVVKIDHYFLLRGSSDANGRAMLTHLIGLVQSLNAIVVIEGVETGKEVELALGLGVIWQQGWHWGRPSAHRPWRVNPRPQGNASAILYFPSAFAPKIAVAELGMGGVA